MEKIPADYGRGLRIEFTRTFLKPGDLRDKSTMYGSLILLTLFCGLGGAIWMAIIAFREGDTMWAIGCMLLSGIVAPIYGIKNFEICRIPTILCIAGFGLRLLLRVGGWDSTS